MAAEFGPAYELKGFLVELMREDADLQFLLFPPDRPQLDPEDRRIYESDADLPTTLRSVLPRITVSVTTDTMNYEQEDPRGDLGPATVYIHHFAARDDSVRIERMEVATTMLLNALGGSTVAVSTRIMVGPLVKQGAQVRDRQPAFDDARRITDTYITRLVGALL